MPVASTGIATAARRGLWHLSQGIEACFPVRTNCVCAWRSAENVEGWKAVTVWHLSHWFACGAEANSPPCRSGSAWQTGALVGADRFK